MIPVIPPLVSRLDISKLHRFCNCWLLKRTDGEVFAFTDHNCRLKIPLNGVESFYTPVVAFSGSAHQRQAGLKESNQDVRGAIVSDLITHKDLRDGKYREAKVTEMLVDWQCPWFGPFYTNVYWVVNTRFDREVWEAQLGGASTWLNKPVGRVYNRFCEAVLFDDDCKVEREDFRVSGAVSVVHVFRETFEPNFSGFDDGWFDDGEIVWLTGANSGTVSEIQSFKSGLIDLYIPLSNDIQVGDTFDAFPGCDKTPPTCKDKFNNIINNRSFPFLPGSDRLILVPSSKS